MTNTKMTEPLSTQEAQTLRDWITVDGELCVATRARVSRPSLYRAAAGGAVRAASAFAIRAAIKARFPSIYPPAMKEAV